MIMGEWVRTHKSILMLIIMSMGSIGIIYSAFLCGKQFLMFTDMGFDTIYQFYPMYVHLIDTIKEGTFSLWNFTWGLGCDTFTRQEWIMDPFGLMTIASGLVFGVKSVQYVLVWMQCLKCLICAIGCYKFLGYFAVSDKARVIGAYLYGMNGFLMLWGQHYYFGAACVYLIVLLWVLEYVMHLEKPTVKACLSLTLVVAGLFLYSVYFGYMIMVFASVYALLRILYKNKGMTLRSFFARIWPLLLAALVGILISGVMLLPFAELTFQVSTRMTGQESLIQRFWNYLTTLYPSTWYMMMLNRGISNNVLGIASLDQYYYELPQLTFSFFHFLMLPQLIWSFVRRKKENGRKKTILLLGAVVLCAFCFLVPFAPFLFNGLGAPFNSFGAPIYRFTFVFMPLFAMGYAVVVDDIWEKKTSVVILLLSVGIYFGLRKWACMYDPNYDQQLGKIILASVVVMAVGIIIIKYFKNQVVVYGTAGILVCILAVTVCHENYISNNDRELVGGTENGIGTDFYKESWTQEYIQQLQQKDSSFYRMEKGYTVFYKIGEGQVLGYDGNAMYCSTMSSPLQQFYEHIWPEAITNTEFQLEHANALKEILGLTNTKYILNSRELDLNQYTWLTLVEQNRDIYLYQNVYAGSLGILYQRTITPAQFEALAPEKRNQLLPRYLILEGESTVSDAQLQTELEQDVMPSFDNTTSQFTRINDAHITGTVTAQADSKLFLSIPYRKGWNVYVDGIRAEVVNADYGFMAVELAAGQHEVVLRYENPVYWYGVCVSIAGILLLAVWCMCLRRFDTKTYICYDKI